MRIEHEQENSMLDHFSLTLIPTERPKTQQLPRMVNRSNLLLKEDMPSILEIKDSENFETKSKNS